MREVPIITHPLSKCNSIILATTYRKKNYGPEKVKKKVQIVLTHVEYKPLEN